MCVCVCVCVCVCAIVYTSDIQCIMVQNTLVALHNCLIHSLSTQQAQNYKTAASPLMSLETQLMAIEVVYLWRALPFCGDEVRRQLLEVLQVPLPPEAQPFHHALSAWLTGGVLNSMQRFTEAETVIMQCVGVRDVWCDVWEVWVSMW